MGFAFLFLFLYIAASLYLGYNIWVVLRDGFSYERKRFFFLLMMLLTVSFALGKMLSSLPLELVGGYWMILTAYGIILLPLLNVLYFLGKKRGVKWFGLAGLLVYAGILAVGSFNAWTPTVKTYHVTIKKDIPTKDLKVLVASDFHLSELITNEHLQRFVDLSDDIKPDLILLPGDILDGDVEPFLTHNMGETMKGLSAPLGVYATLGNHEYYGDDIPVFLQEMERAGIEMLTDETILVDEQIYLVGRNDFHDKYRKPLSELVKETDKEKPVFMLEHQPVEFDIAAENGIDLSVSGHTHRAQLFPGYLITQRLFENDYGYMKKEQLHTIVTSGFGLWGPLIRIGSRSEAVVIHVHFEPK